MSRSSQLRVLQPSLLKSQQGYGNIIPTAVVVAKTMLLADRIRSRMEACGLSQAALAREVGVSQQSIGRLVTGGAMGSRYLHKIAAALATTPAYLTGETDDPESDVPDDALTADERELLDHFRKLSPKDRSAARQIVESLADREPKPSATLHAPSRSFAGPDQRKGKAA